MLICVIFIFFFFKQKTAYEMRISDWSSDVCSSDLLAEIERRRIEPAPRLEAWHAEIAGWRRAWQDFIRPGFETHSQPIRPERIVADCRAVLPDDAIISLDSGIHHNWFMQLDRKSTRLNSSH